MDQMDDDSWQKWVSILEENDWHTLRDFDLNSAGEEFKGDSSVVPAEYSLKESSTTLLSNFPSLEENTGFDMTSFTQQHVSPRPKSCVLSFENFTSVPIFDKKTCQHLGEHSNQTQEKTRKPLKRERNSSQTLDHIMAERKRRENLTKMFIALSALIPGLKKVDKVSVLNKAIEYVKCLEQRVKDLEKENKKRKIESEGCLKVSKSNMVGYDFSWISHACNDGDKASKKCSKVEARVAGKDVLIRVTCEMQRNIVQNVMAKLEAHNLSVVSSNVLPFGNSAITITSIAEMNPKFTTTVDNFVKTLTEDLSKCCNL
ncbi:transcription factor bHLH18-like [Vigna umbellata]|uniref:transcription factor bHLH18-like n=1 Tax=Vigna umbellata TaxID=87088 RepID=UPI001F5F5478|nr:transcription factor bHLH18-like [Vigna umbellata]